MKMRKLVTALTAFVIATSSVTAMTTSAVENDTAAVMSVSQTDYANLGAGYGDKYCYAVVKGTSSLEVNWLELELIQEGFGTSVSLSDYDVTFEVYRQEYLPNAEGSISKLVATTKKSSFTDTGLKAGRLYEYQVFCFAKDKAGKKFLVTWFACYSRTKPSGATAKKPGVTNNAVRLKWKKQECDGYYIYQKQANGKFKKIAVLDEWTTNYKVTKLKANTKYEFKIRPYSIPYVGIVFGKCAEVTVRTKK